MKIFLLAAVFILFLTVCTGTEEPRVRTYSIKQFYKNTQIFGGSFSPDNKNLLVTSNRTGIYNVYALPVDGAEPRPLTHSTGESFFAVSYLPDGNGFLYSADEGGNENNHLFWVDSSGRTVDITPFEKSKSSFYKWSRDGRSFLFTSNRRDAKYFDLYEKEVAAMNKPLALTMLYKNTEGFSIGPVSDSKRYIALVRAITTSRNELFLHDRESNRLKRISAEGADASYDPQYFDRQGTWLYYLTNEGGEFTYLARYNLKTGDKENVFSTNWDVWYAYASYNEKYRVIGINQDARTVIHLQETADGREVEVPAIEGGSISSVSFSRDESLLRLTVSSSAAPGNIHVYNPQTKKLTRLTQTLNPEINPSDLVEGRVIRYESFDGLEIPAILYMPHQASPARKAPALVWVHGGPGGQSRLRYFALIQYLVNHGYAVLAVNNRGSSGYGKTFNRMDDRNHGEADLKDCIAGKDYLAALDEIDGERIGIIGGSYGGYMVMAALAFAPEAFDAGVNIFGVTNWLRTLKSVPPYWESFRQALYAELGDPFTADSVRLKKISPLFHASNVLKPLMVLQGANDPRVLQVESDEIVEAVRANGVPVEYVLFPDEGHGFRKKENEIKGYGQVLTFLDKYLKGQKNP